MGLAVPGYLKKDTVSGEEVSILDNRRPMRHTQMTITGKAVNTHYNRLPGDKIKQTNWVLLDRHLH